MNKINFYFVLAFCFLLSSLSVYANPCSSFSKETFEELATPFYDLESNKHFLVDPSNSTNDMVRICVPLMYPNWFVVPASSIEELKAIGDEEIDSSTYKMADIQFKKEYDSLNSLLPSVQELIKNANHIDGKAKWGWSPPWKWSKCAKCQLTVNTFITVSVMAAVAAAGTTGPGVLAVWSAMITGAYGLAAWKAVEALIFSAGVGEISKAICKARGDC